MLQRWEINDTKVTHQDMRLTL